MQIELKHEDRENGIGYTEVTDKRLKTNNIYVYFYEYADSERAAKNSVLPLLLTDSSAEFPSITAMNRHLSSLYGASLRSGSRSIGDYHALSVYASCLADDFTIGGEKITDRMIDTLTGCIFGPHTVDGVFDEAEFELKRKEILDEIDAEINDKRSYAFKRAAETIYRGEPASVHINGKRADAEKITSAGSFARYKELLAKARIEIITIGSGISPEHKERLLSSFSAIKREHSMKCTRVCSPCKHEPEFVTEKLEIAQSKMVMALKTDFPDTPAMTVFNSIYGGSTFSKLFTNVREKMSLCYYCSSVYSEPKGVLYVDSGIEHGNIDKARTEMLRQLDLMKSGDFSDENIANAKTTITNMLKSVNDSPAMIARRYMQRILFGNTETPEETAEKVRAVTREDIVRAAESLSLDTVYVLTGKEGK